MDMGMGIMADQEAFEKVAELYRDSHDNIVVNWPSHITVSQMRGMLEKAVAALKDMTAQIQMGEFDSDGRLIVPMRETNPAG